jgi:hypothetical protein
MSSLRDFADYVSGAAEGAAEAVSETASAAVETVTETASSGYEAAQGTASETYATAQETASQAYGYAQETASQANSAAQETASDAYNTARETASEAYNTVQETASTASESVQDTASEVYEGAQGAVSYVENAASQAYESVQETASEAYGGVQAAAEYVEEAVATAGETGSPWVNPGGGPGGPDDPDLWDKAKEALGEAADAAGSAAEAVSDAVSDAAQPASPDDAIGATKIINYFVDAANKTQGDLVSAGVDWATQQGVISADTAQTIKNADQVVQGVGQGAGDLAAGAIHMAANPLGATAEMVEGAAVKGYKEGGGGVSGVLNAAKELNPMNLGNPLKQGVESAVKAYQAGSQGNYKEAGRQGTHAAADAAAVVGAFEGGVEPVEPVDPLETADPVETENPTEPPQRVRVADDVVDDANAADEARAEDQARPDGGGGDGDGGDYNPRRGQRQGIARDRAAAREASIEDRADQARGVPSTLEGMEDLDRLEDVYGREAREHLAETGELPEDARVENHHPERVADAPEQAREGGRLVDPAAHRRGLHQGNTYRPTEPGAPLEPPKGGYLEIETDGSVRGRTASQMTEEDLDAETFKEWQREQD